MCRPETGGIGQAVRARQARPDKDRILLTTYLSKRLQRSSALFDTLRKFGLPLTGSPPSIEVYEKRLPTLFAAMKEIGCSVRESEAGDCIIIEQPDEAGSRDRAETKTSSDPSSQITNSRPQSAQPAKRMARPSSAPASRSTTHSPPVSKAQWPKVHLAFEQPKQTLEEQSKSVARLSKKRAPPRPQGNADFAAQTKHISAPDVETQQNSCARLCTPLNRMSRTRSEAFLSERERAKTMLTSHEQDQLFARLAVPRRGEHTIAVDIGNVGDWDKESNLWELHKQTRPSSATQQHFCTRLAAPKKRMQRPRSATAIRVVDPAAQRSFCNRLSEPKGTLRSNAGASCKASRHDFENGSLGSRTDTFMAWGVFDEKKAAFWVQQQAHALEMLEQNRDQRAYNSTRVSPSRAAPSSRPTSAPCSRPHRHPVQESPESESFVSRGSNGPPVPKLPPLESLLVREQCKHDNDPFSTDLDTSDFSSSLSSSDFSSICSDRGNEAWTDGISAQLPARMFPIQRPQCLATSDDEETIANSNGLVGWQLTRGCVPWASEVL